jgi:hypothetical protein
MDWQLQLITLFVYISKYYDQGPVKVNREHR